MLTFSIITITAFVTFLDNMTILVMKNLVKNDFKKVIPLFSLFYGLGLGIAGFYTPNVEMGTNLIEAIFIGLSAGAAATGVDQVTKQLSKGKDCTALDIITTFNDFMGSMYVPDESCEPDTSEENPTEDEMENESENDTDEEEKTEEDVVLVPEDLFGDDDNSSYD